MTSKKVATRKATPVVISNAAPVLEIISRAASDPSVDIDKLERLMEMHERILLRDAEVAFNRAMTSSQTTMKRIAADANNPQTRSKYASYGRLDQVLRPIYTEHGFSLSFNTGDSATDGYVRVTCDVAHCDGYSKHFKIDMPADGKGAKGGDVMTKTHATGAAMSYGMRYLLKMIFNVAVGEDDNDGNEVVAVITASQAADLMAKIEEVGADQAKFLKYYGAETLESFPANKLKAAHAGLEKKGRAA